MPVPNDLTPEEEREFTQMGVPPAGPGMEPTGEPNQPPPQHGDRQPVAPPVEMNRDPATGQFTARQPEPQAPPVPPVDTNAPPAQPADPNAPPAQGQQPSAPPPPGFVPHAALHEARQREAAARAQFAQLQARTNAILMSRQAEQPQPAQPLPSLEEDPVGYITGLEQRLNAFEQSRQEEQQYRQIDQGIEQDENTFRSYTPDYDAASDHYVNSRAAELLNFYPPQEAHRIMLQEARQMAQQAWARGVPAAQMVYQMAQARGWRPGAPPAPTYAPPAPAAPALQPTYTPPAGIAPPAAPVYAPLSPHAVVAAAQQGQQAAQSLSAATGGAAPAVLNAEALLAMSDEEFEAQFKLGGKGANDRFAAIAGR